VHDDDADAVDCADGNDDRQCCNIVALGRGFVALSVETLAAWGQGVRVVTIDAMHGLWI